MGRLKIGGGQSASNDFITHSVSLSKQIWTIQNNHKKITDKRH